MLQPTQALRLLSDETLNGCAAIARKRLADSSEKNTAQLAQLLDALTDELRRRAPLQ